MSVKYYDKLIRDNIPEIIEQSGKVADTYVAEDREYHQRLIDKLKEELVEYESSFNVEELADIMEVLEALIKTHEIDNDTFIKLKNTKRDKNGAFDKKLILTKVSKK